MKRAQFTEIGEALYGPSWRYAVAAPLRVSERTVRRWQDGVSAIPGDVPGKLAALCRKHADKLKKLADQIEART